MDKDIQMVAEFMQTRLPVWKLGGVAAGLNALAPVLWGHYPARDVVPLMLRHNLCMADDPREPLDTSG